MSIQYGVLLRNAQLDAIAAQAGASAKLRIYSGSPPADCATAASGTLLVEMALPSTWMAAAGSGSVAKTGTWSGTGTAGAGAGTNAGYWRLVDSAGTTCHAQGTITVTGGGGDLTLDNISIANGQTVTISSFSISALNA
jgi:hypothetical protein